MCFSLSSPTLFCSLSLEEVLAQFFFSSHRKSLLWGLPANTSSAPYQIPQTIASWLTSILPLSGVTVAWLRCLRDIASGLRSEQQRWRRCCLQTKGASLLSDGGEERIPGEVSTCIVSPGGMLSLSRSNSWVLMKGRQYKWTMNASGVDKLLIDVGDTAQREYDMSGTLVLSHHALNVRWLAVNTYRFHFNMGNVLSPVGPEIWAYAMC